MKQFKQILILLILVISTTSFNQKKAKILIIGDSISIGYTPFVQEELKNRAEVFHNPGNAQHTGKGLDSIASWIGDIEWDLIQFNWGLWDLCYRHPDSNVQGKRDKLNGTITFTPEEYEKQLDAIVKIIREKSDAELIFVTTTYVPTAEAGRFSKDAKKYNKIAKRVMKANGVKVNDIYKASINIHAKYGKGNDNVHYNPEGYEDLGRHISDFIEQEIRFSSN
ncbi:SGNH/GDSL hydrolase family protein [Mangrovibacterium sp.]|uniref:SGNH/GDSL hydrolase family protein n=1 Tax=Mangrovibacterium sp. TaxID=1961364 RepID=UPI003567141C